MERYLHSSLCFSQQLGLNYVYFNKILNNVLYLNKYYGKLKHYRAGSKNIFRNKADIPLLTPASAIFGSFFNLSVWWWRLKSTISLVSTSNWSIFKALFRLVFCRNSSQYWAPTKNQRYVTKNIKRRKETYWNFLIMLRHRQCYVRV